MQRIQRKRTKGWRMPANAVYVGRPTKWGNPFPLDGINGFTRAWSLKNYRISIKRIVKTNPHFLDALKGKDLACWCRLDQPCHADILIEKLNQMTT